jgi:hypothetical protein
MVVVVVVVVVVATHNLDFRRWDNVDGIVTR